MMLARLMMMTMPMMAINENDNRDTFFRDDEARRGPLDAAGKILPLPCAVFRNIWLCSF
jgi:hypothetical protein